MSRSLYESYYRSITSNKVFWNAEGVQSHSEWWSISLPSANQSQICAYVSGGVHWAGPLSTLTLSCLENASCLALLLEKTKIILVYYQNTGSWHKRNGFLILFLGLSNIVIIGTRYSIKNGPGPRKSASAHFLVRRSASSIPESPRFPEDLSVNMDL